MELLSSCASHFISIKIITEVIFNKNMYIYFKYILVLTFLTTVDVNQVPYLYCVNAVTADCFSE